MLYGTGIVIYCAIILSRGAILSLLSVPPALSRSPLCKNGPQKVGGPLLLAAALYPVELGVSGFSMYGFCKKLLLT